MNCPRFCPLKPDSLEDLSALIYVGFHVQETPSVTGLRIFPFWSVGHKRCVCDQDVSWRGEAKAWALDGIRLFPILLSPAHLTGSMLGPPAFMGVTELSSRCTVWDAWSLDVHACKVILFGLYWNVFFPKCEWFCTVDAVILLRSLKDPHWDMEWGRLVWCAWKYWIFWTILSWTEAQGPFCSQSWGWQMFGIWDFILSGAWLFL